MNDLLNLAMKGRGTTPQLVAPMRQGAMVGSPVGTPRKMADSSYPSFWQIFGKMGFDDKFPQRGESANRSVFIDDFDGGPAWT